MSKTMVVKEGERVVVVVEVEEDDDVKLDVPVDDILPVDRTVLVN